MNEHMLSYASVTLTIPSRSAYRTSYHVRSQPTSYELRTRTTLVLVKHVIEPQDVQRTTERFLVPTGTSSSSRVRTHRSSGTGCTTTHSSVSIVWFCRGHKSVPEFALPPPAVPWHHYGRSIYCARIWGHDAPSRCWTFDGQTVNDPPPLRLFLQHCRLISLVQILAIGFNIAPVTKDGRRHRRPIRSGSSIVITPSADVYSAPGFTRAWGFLSGHLLARPLRPA
jgi:hypothetical protein